MDFWNIYSFNRVYGVFPGSDWGAEGVKNSCDLASALVDGWAGDHREHPGHPP